MAMDMVRTEEEAEQVWDAEKRGQLLTVEHEGRVYVVARWLAEACRFELDHEHDDYMMAALAQWETDGGV